MIINLIRNGMDGSALISALLSIPIVLISLSMHELAHGYAALKMGDPTARNLGRLTLNPAKHLDPFGTLCMLLWGFGWARPVPVNARNFDKPRKGMAITAAAGPLMNIILSFIGLLLYRITASLTPSAAMAQAFMQDFGGNTPFAVKLTYAALMFFWVFHLMNLYLAIFNLIPVPPLDGSRIFFIFLPDKLYFKIMKYEPMIQLFLMLALFLDWLTVPLATVCGYISDGMSFIIGLIPGL